jgi:nitrogen regulatory protein PII
MEGESMFKKLTVVVNRGMAEDVMDIARKSGVNGGTIIHGRGTGSEFTTKFFGMDIEPEKELVMILMPSDLIGKVVNDLFQELQLGIPGNGILFVEPIEEVRGLFDSHLNNKNT